MAETSFVILCLCTGNVCRSPAAERLLARALGPTVTVVSAGTHALVGEPLSPPMDDLVEQAGAEAEHFAAQLASTPLLRGADLVLGMAREHRSAAVDLAPATVRRAFTLREYARLLVDLDPDRLPDGTPAERARASIPLAAAGRRRAAPAEDDVADPYRRGPEAYRVAFDQIDRAVAMIADRLTTPGGQPSGWSAT